MKHIFTISISIFISLAAFSQAGTLDKSFSADGKAVIGFAYGGVAGEDDLHDLAIQSDGKSVLVGRSNATAGGDYNFVVTRLNTDGTLDKSFNGKGYIFINFYRDDEADAVAIQPDGKIVIAGNANTNSITPKIAVARLLTNGVPDPSFGSNFSGKVITDFGDNEPYANTVAIQGDGKIVVGGGFHSYGSKSECLLLRYNTDGTLDQSFGVLGKSFTDFGSEQTAQSVAVQTDGKIVVGAEGSFGSPVLARFNYNGSPDGGFGNKGKRIIGLDGCAAIAIQGNGKIVVTGVYQGDRPNFAVARYNINGTIDTTFSGDGKVITNINTYSSDDWPHDVAIQGDGKIVVAGVTYGTDGSAENFALVRYNKNGTLDNTFGDQGKVITDFGNSQNGNYERAYAVGIQSNGKIVAAGTRNENVYGNFAIARYHGDIVMPGSSVNAAAANSELVTDNFSSIRIYPNPVEATLHLEGLNTSSPVTISITDLKQIVFQESTVTTSEYQFNLSALKPGVYFLNIIEDNVLITRKFIKQ